MAILRLEPHPVSVAWAASGGFSLELSPKPYTITRIGIFLSLDITTTTVTMFSDSWDRQIATLTLSGSGKTYFSFSNMRIAYHFTRMRAPQVTTKRPGLLAGSQTAALTQMGYLLHLGVCPMINDPKSGHSRDNPWDLTSGIPPAGAGNLTLTGTFGGSTAGGTNVTTNASGNCTLDVLLWGVQPESGDPVEAWMPRTIPVWSQRTPTPTATSTPFATQDNIPAGDFLHSMLVMLTQGTNAPRNDQVLSSIQVYNQLESRVISQYGGRADLAIQGKMAEIFSQTTLGSGWPPSEDSGQASTGVGVASGGGTAAPGVPAVTMQADAGLIYLPIWKQANKALLGGLFGADLRHIATGDLQLRYGVKTTTTITMDVLYQKYQLNPLHPANVGL